MHLRPCFSAACLAAALRRLLHRSPEPDPVRSCHGCPPRRARCRRPRAAAAAPQPRCCGPPSGAACVRQHPAASDQPLCTMMHTGFRMQADFMPLDYLVQRSHRQRRRQQHETSLYADASSLGPVSGPEQATTEPVILSRGVSTGDTRKGELAASPHRCSSASTTGAWPKNDAASSGVTSRRFCRFFFAPLMHVTVQ